MISEATGNRAAGACVVQELVQESEEGVELRSGAGLRALVVLSPKAGGEAVDRIMELVESGALKTTVYVKYVVDMDPVLSVYFQDTQFDAMKMEGQRIVDCEANRLRDRGIQVEVLPSHFGIAAEEVLRVEKQIRPDLIVIGAPRTSRVRRLLWADFSTDVVRQAISPVLTVRPQGDGEAGHYRQAARTFHAQASAA